MEALEDLVLKTFVLTQDKSTRMRWFLYCLNGKANASSTLLVP